MFEIDDNFLQNIGYNVANLSEDEKNRHKAELTEELQERLNERLGSELEEDQVEDLESIQQSSNRAKQWLEEFHNDYEGSEDYIAIREALGEDEAWIFYASALWMQDAIPDYGKIVRKEFDNYQVELIEKRQMANKAFGI